MPATSIRDLIVKDDDVVVGTHGRGFWILDNVTPLRQLNAEVASAPAFLFKPQTAYRVRWNTNTDTPLPPDEPALPNPPDGAMIDYVLKSAASGPVMLDIMDSAGRVIRHYSSEDHGEAPDPAAAPVPLYWYRPPQQLSSDAGMHRWLWDLHYQPLPGAPQGRGGLPIAAVPHNTVPSPTTPWAPPGTYTVKLTVDGRSYTQPLMLRMDPRVKTSPAGLQQQFTLSKALYDGIANVQTALDQLRALREQVKDRRANGGPAAEALADYDRKADALEGRPPAGFGGGRGGAPDTFDTLNSIRAGLAQLLSVLEGADVAPTTQLVAAIAERRADLVKVINRWTTLKSSDLAALNAKLKAAHVTPITIPSARSSNQ
jgi:hypothetical protein